MNNEITNKKILVNDGSFPVNHIFEADNLKYLGTPQYVTSGNDYFSISYDGDNLWVYYIPDDYEEDEFDYMAEGPAALPIDNEEMENRQAVRTYLKDMKFYGIDFRFFIANLASAIEENGDFLGLGKKRIKMIKFMKEIL